MTDYTAFYLNRSGSVTPIECIEMSHPNFDDSFRYTSDDTYGVTVKHENGGADFYYQYQPMTIKRSTVSNNLDQKISLTIGDVDDKLIMAADKARLSEYWKSRPKVKWRLYRDDNLTIPLVTLQTLEVASISKDDTGNCTFEAVAPELNSVKTGEIYDLERFPLLRGLI
ncbi:hypothetical protein [Acinetobacter calcoaceticus]|uniref:hypothetical protein n=1 Tax=Acinetobacter calcoaceticus TaxID=471 RepID=UPI0018DCB216|nr:hypothetical protein [Acinetobacter calcoaceticus]